MIASSRRPSIPQGLQDLVHVLDRALAQVPDQEALVSRHNRYTYRELDAAVCAAAAALASLGVRTGDRVAASAGNHCELVISFLATQWLGAIWVGIGRHLAPAEKLYMLADCSASVLMGDRMVCQQMAPLQHELPTLRHIVDMEAGDAGSPWAQLLQKHRGAGRPGVDVDPFAPAAIAYTSGTTGYPKGCVQSQHNMVLVSEVQRWLKPDDPVKRRGSALPMTIINMIILVVLRSIQTCGTCICMDRVDAVGSAEWVKRERIQTFPMAPTTLQDLLTNPAIQPDDLKTLVSPGVGGGSLSDEVRAMYRQRFGTEPQFSYGLTEAPSMVTLTDPSRPMVAGASGTVIPQMELRIANEMGEALPPGEVGEVLVGPARTGFWAGVYTPMLGYWMKPQATAEALRDGWLHTGDHGYVDAQGHLYISGRAKELIIRGGANVYPAEVERVLGGDKRIAAVAVVGKPDERLGETIAAFVQLAPGVTPYEGLADSLRADCLGQLAKYKVPTDWIFVDEMPRNAMRKIVKADLVRHYFKTPA
ncbi:MAG: class I adenylate-forming enzyme family protein [Burkholderiaceae bacterium]|nr:class I adenylate-forming enzyme family protein [Burkholderiaceae bacterium]